MLTYIIANSGLTGAPLPQVQATAQVRVARVIRRQSLRDVSRWVWALIALAIVWFTLQLIAQADSISLSILYGAFLGATPALFAAALVYVAPRVRLIWIAALAFAFPVAVQALLGAAILISTQNLGHDYAYLPERFAGLAAAFSLVAWVFPIIAVTALARYIGPITGRVGWLAVAVGATLGLAQAIVSVASIPLDQVPLEQVLAGVLGQLVWVAWAYLLAASLGERLVLMTTAAATHLLGGLVSFIAFTLLLQGLFNDPNSLPTQVILAALWLLGLVSWITLIGGILREIPMLDRAEQPQVATTKRSLSAGR